MSCDTMLYTHHYTHTWVMFKNRSATSPITKLDVEQAGPSIISFGGCDGSVSVMRWYNDAIDEHYSNQPSS